TGGTADRNRSHWSTSKTPSYTKSVSWQHHRVTTVNNGFLSVNTKINSRVVRPLHNLKWYAENFFTL
ncbi:hypothetical protein, partial [Enterobacter hormaechei]|uniref:hypothetical protein n=1 Tax=Enterobacter hormaechei TaxID=158836 RepID=UPI001ED9E251